MRRQLGFFLLVIVGLCGANTAVAQQSAQLTNGQSVRGRLVQQGEAFLFVSTDGKNWPLAPVAASSATMGNSAPAVRSILCDAPTAQLLSTTPLRQLYMAGGDLLVGEALSAGTDSWRVRFRGLPEVVVPQGAISAIAQPAGQVVRMYEDFSSPNEKADSLSHSPPQALRLSSGAARVWTLPEPLSAGKIQIWFLGSLESNEFGVELTGAKETAVKLQLLLGGSGDFYEVAGGAFAVQRLRRSAGWHCLSVTLAEGRVRAAVDGALLADGRGGLKSIEQIRVYHAAGDAAPEIRFDDLLVVEQVSAVAEPLRLAQSRQDLVVQISGDELFGRVQDATPTQVRLQGPLGKFVLPWNALRSVAWGNLPAPAARPVRGVFARIELSTAPGFGDEPIEFLTGAIHRLSETGIEFEHPWLGRVSLPLREVRRIEFDGQGERWLVDGRSHHLGDEVRDDFSRPLPEGSTLSASKTFESPPMGDTFVLVNVADLEPSGPQTPPDAPYLQQLRQGNLVTELWVNEEKVVDLNRFVSQRAGPAGSVRVRIPVPPRLWKKGANTLKFVQRAQADEPTHFDDCELSVITIVSPR